MESFVFFELEKLRECVIPGIADKAEAVILFKYRCTYIVFGKSFVDSNACAKADYFQFACQAFF